MLTAGHRVVVPEVADYEVLRELLRRGAATRVTRLDLWTARRTGPCGYLRITRWVMRRVAALWALARQTGQPTAGDDTIDADMILVAQAESLNHPNTVIATTNVGHLSRFFPADLWSNVTP
ncbi:MAG: nuclease [Isosphaera sp.]|nr:nuclease [Isosphaera sp.]